MLKYTPDSKYYSLLIDFKLNARENLELELCIKKTLGYQKGFWFLFMRGSCKQTNQGTNRYTCMHTKQSVSA